ncbi:MAG: CPBP family intramembrane metalloprotease, partial [Deltaproteobacteria bacterium]
APVASADPGPARPRRVGLGHALGFYFAFVALLLPLLALSDATLAALDVVDGLALGLALLAVAVAPRQMLPLLRRPRLTRKGTLLAVLAVAAVFAYVQLASHLAPALFGDDLLIAYLLDGRSLAVTLVSMSLLPAVTEELIFRGVILEGLLSVFDRRTAVITSTALFVTIHLSPLNIIHIGALGLLFAEVRLRTGSVYPAMLLHGAYNAAVTVVAWPL